MLNAPTVAEPLGLYDCCGVSDGAACAIVTTPEIARSLGKTDMVSVKALQVAVSNGTGGPAQLLGRQLLRHHAHRRPSAPTPKPASTSPREQLSLIEVHDCFSVTELVTMEDLHVSPEGGAIKDVLDGFYDADGKIPCQIDGGLKCFGHPDRRLGPAHDLRDVPADAGPRRRAPAQGGAALRLDAQPGRLPAQNVCVDLD